MPVYIRKGPLEIPPGSEKDWSVDDEEDYFLKDPDKALDYLPQPYRMIDRELDLLIDQAWEIITINEQNREAEKLKTKILIHEPNAEIHMTRRVNCIASGKSGTYIFVGLSEGVAVYRVSDLQWICGWEEPNVEICSLDVCHVKNEMYLIAAVDDMGIGRLLILAEDKLNLLKIINVPEDLSKRTNCIHFEIAEGGEYAAVFLEGNHECWLEIYRMPKDSWLKELESSQISLPPTEAPSSTPTLPLVNTPSVETKFTPPTLTLKIKPPKPLTGSSFRNLQESVQKSEDCSMFGTGQNHIISAQQWDQQKAIFRDVFQKYLDLESHNITDGQWSRHVSFHFVQSNKILLGELDRIPGVMPNAVTVHWNDCHNLYFYLLGAPSKDKSEIEPKPDLVWPCAAAITCSAVSSCFYLALGLQDGTLTIWDMKYSGFPLAVVDLPEGKCMDSLYFLECHTANRDSPPTPRAQLLVWCTDKSLYLLTGAEGTESNIVLIRESSINSDAQISAVMPVQSLPNGVLLFYRSGIVELMDISLKEAVCQFSLPFSHWVAFPWQPVYAFDSENLFLFLKGNEKMAAGEIMAEGVEACSLFTFNLNSLQLMDAFKKMQHTSLSLSQNLHWEQRCKIVLQNRLHSFPERKKKIAECWSKLKKQASPLIY
ncbi:WD repeat-containing protein 93 isoform X1 [Pelobates fuscus]|uniref:WD repeat-containing protein 93 isoform X1 n=1 Tax=Pelobates fuscus TaxID=191477 RepID=UPI002FE4E822